MTDATLREIQSSWPTLPSVPPSWSSTKVGGWCIRNLCIVQSGRLPRRRCAWGRVHCLHVLMLAFLYISCSCVRAWLHMQCLHGRQTMGWARLLFNYFYVVAFIKASTPKCSSTMVLFSSTITATLILWIANKSLSFTFVNSWVMVSQSNEIADITHDSQTNRVNSESINSVFKLGFEVRWLVTDNDENA